MQSALESGALESVFVAMRRHPESEMVQRFSASSLANLCHENTVVKLRALQAGVPALLKDALHSHMDSPELTANALLALGNMGDVPQLAAAFAEVGLLEEIIAAMRLHPEELQVQRHGLEAIGNICDESSSRQQRAVSEDAVDVILNALGRWGVKSEAVAEAGICGALEAVSQLGVEAAWTEASGAGLPEESDARTASWDQGVRVKDIVKRIASQFPRNEVVRREAKRVLERAEESAEHAAVQGLKRLRI
eukprot:gnl/TRDRNA2_/TRDRNA2_133337_c0_seq1.p1 gnl/TRDRNA2_/TRDRNA2_133337_c0~~gnl/TRDRNA2_/TRDRNA2_133337_c0_seq1.p1  ORF type:complete len:250 (+),score=49.11 gnl/TRDRNA2_/TRDRNA2_133337_c0_seq1:436-1185(+)